MKDTIYTYVVNHKLKSPTINASTKINDGKLVAVMFEDAFIKLEKLGT